MEKTLSKQEARMRELNPPAPKQTHCTETGLLLPEFREDAAVGCDHSMPHTYPNGAVHCSRCAFLLQEPPKEEAQ